MFVFLSEFRWFGDWKVDAVECNCELVLMESWTLGTKVQAEEEERVYSSLVDTGAGEAKLYTGRKEKRRELRVDKLCLYVSINSRAKPNDGWAISLTVTNLRWFTCVCMWSLNILLYILYTGLCVWLSLRSSVYSLQFAVRSLQFTGSRKWLQVTGEGLRTADCRVETWGHKPQTAACKL